MMRRFLGIFLAVSTIGLILAATPAGAGVKISEFGTPSASSAPEGITLGSDGNIWYTECNLGNVGVLTPTKPPSFGTEYSVGGCPNSITAGPDKNLWFTDNFNSVAGSFGTYQSSAIGRITTSGSVTEFPVPVVSVPSGFINQGVAVSGITTGPDGNLWFTEYQEAYELNPTESWFYGVIGQITPSGTITTFVIPGPHIVESEPGGGPGDITTGPDGNLWFTLSGELGQATPGGSITLFPGDLGYGIAAWNGALWTTAYTFIGRYNTSGTGTTTPLSSSDYAIGGLAPENCSDNLWFTSGELSNTVGTINNVFSVTPYKTPTSNSSPYSIVAAGNGTQWFTEEGAGQIGRIDDLLGQVACVPYLPGSVFLNSSVKGTMGGTVGWQMLDPGLHGVADASGMQLFGFSPTTGGPDPIPIGSSTSFTFDWAGTYPYDDPFNTTASGLVDIPLTVGSVAGPAGPAAQVTWATADAPAGFGFDVEVKAPHSHGTFVPWQTGVSNLSAVFGSADPLWVGPGKYSFEARLRNLSSGAASGFSKPKGILLSS